MEIGEKIKGLHGLRKEARVKQINSIANSFYNYLKAHNYPSFRKTLLTSFYPNEMNTRNMLSRRKGRNNFMTDHIQSISMVILLA